VTGPIGKSADGMTAFIAGLVHGKKSADSKIALDLGDNNPSR
jgi:hypothetical protein